MEYDIRLNPQRGRLRDVVLRLLMCVQAKCGCGIRLYQS